MNTGKNNEEVEGRDTEVIRCTLGECYVRATTGSTVSKGTSKEYVVRDTFN